MHTLRTKIITGYGGIAILAIASLLALYLHSVTLATVLLLLLLIFSGFFLHHIVRSIVQPLKHLSDSTRALQTGVNDHIDLPAASPEMRELAASIDHLAQQDRQHRASEGHRLRRTQQTASAVIESLAHPAALLSAEGIVEIVNAPAEKFGLTPGGHVSQSPFKALAPLIDDVRRTHIASANPPPDPAVNPYMPSPFDAHQPLIQLFIEGNERFFMPNATPVLAPDGELIGITLLLEDFTHKREIDEAKSGLMSTLSHQFKTPMTSIQMAVHLLLEDTIDHLTPRQRDLLQTAAEDADRLHKLIEDLLTTARDKR